MTLRSCSIRALLLVGLCVFAIGLQGEAAGQSVAGKARIGGYSEDIAYVPRGRLRDKIIVLDGYEVFAVENARRPSGPLTRLFSVIVPELNVRPNGITYIESEGLFAFNDVTQPTKLFLFDDRGAFKGTRNIQYPGGYFPQHMEGLAYLPSSSPAFPDHILVVALDTLNGPSRIEVTRRDGQVVEEIHPAWPPPPASDPDNPIYDTSFMGDVTFLAPNKLLVTFYPNTIWTIDFAGNVLAGPHVLAEANGGEGIVQMNDERIVTVNYPQSLRFFDKNLNRQPESDRNDVIGLNLNLPSGVAWNPDTNQLLIKHNVPGIPFSAAGPGIASVPTSLNSAAAVVDLSVFPRSSGLTYLPGEHLIATTHANGPRAILLFNSDGTLNSQIDLSPGALGQNLGPPQGITFIPGTNEFAVRFNGIAGDPGQPAERRRLRIFSRAGALVRTVDLTCTGTNGVGAFAYFDDPGGGGGRFMVFGTAGRVFVTDLNGDPRNAAGIVIREFNSRVKLGALSPTAVTPITTGPMSGVFAMVDHLAGEVVLFRLD